MTVFHKCRGFFKFDLSLLFITILALSSFPCFLKNVIYNIFNGLSHFLKDPYLFHGLFFLCRVKKQRSAIPACCSQDLAYKLGKTHMHYWRQKFYMPKMAGAFARSSTAGLTAQARVYHAKSCIHQSHFNGKTVIIVCISSYDSCDTHFPEFFRRNKSESDLFYSFWGCNYHNLHLHSIF